MIRWIKCPGVGFREVTADMKKVRLGLLGAGICANTFHWPALMRLKDRFEFVAFAGTNAEQNQEYAQKTGIECIYTDFHDLIADPNIEAIISSYPYFLNEEIIAAAKEAGKHVLVEKPIAQSIEKASRMAAMDDGKVVMGVGENWLYWKTIPTVRDLLDNGEIGDVQLVQQYSYYNIDLEDQYMRGNAWRRTATGGMLLDRAVHAISLLRGMFGNVWRATGYTASIRPELGAFDTMTTLVEYESGIKGTIINCASARNVSLPFSILIIGTRGTIKIGDFMKRIVVSNELGDREIIVDNGAGGYDQEFMDFHEAITNSVTFRSNLRGARNDLFAAMTAFEAPGVWKQIGEV